MRNINMRKLVTIAILVVVAMVSLSAETRKPTVIEAKTIVEKYEKNGNTESRLWDINSYNITWVTRENLEEAYASAKEVLKEKEAKEAAQKAQREEIQLKAAELKAAHAYENSWKHTLAAKRYYDLKYGEGNWATNIDYSKITE